MSLLDQELKLMFLYWVDSILGAWQSMAAAQPIGRPKMPCCGKDH